MPLCGRKSADSIRDRVFHQATKFLALLVGDRGSQVLNLDQSFADEYDLSDFGNASHPRVANELRIEREQPFRFLRVSARRGLPFEQAALPSSLPMASM
jgi:hypothetical protein